MEHKLSLCYTIDENELQRKISAEAQKAACDHLRLMFNDGRFYGSKGTARLVIEETIDKKICSDEAVGQIKKIIDENWTRILHEATVKALEHKANKLAFTAVAKSK